MHGYHINSGNLTPIHAGFDDVMSAVLEVSSRAGTLLSTRYNTVADIHFHDNGNYGVLDRTDNEREFLTTTA